MNPSEKNKTSRIAGILLLAMSLFLAVGVKTLFHACVHEDGTEAVCHWAEQGIFVCAVIQSFTACLLVIFCSRSAQLALSAVTVCTGVITLLVPGVIFRLCMMPSMRCNAVMRPWVLACAIAAILLSLINMICNRKSKKADRSSLA